jgi:hypothetical protein
MKPAVSNYRFRFRDFCLYWVLARISGALEAVFVVDVISACYGLLGGGGGRLVLCVFLAGRVKARTRF